MEAPAYDLPVGALYRAHHAFVRNCLRRSGLDESELDDAVQDVFTTMLGRAGEQYDRARSVRPWLFGISRNLAANARRRGARRSRLRERMPGPPPSPATPEELTERREAARIVEGLFQQIDADTLTPFLLLDIEGLTAAEVAARLELPVTTVRWRARKARAELERLAARESPRRWTGWLVWLWPWHSARLGPPLAWVGVAAAMLAWWLLPTRTPSMAPDEAAPEVVATLARTEATAPASTMPSPTAELGPRRPLRPGAAVSGRVIDTDGRPIAEALVCASIDLLQRTDIDEVEPQCSRSDAQGRYSLEGIASGLQRVGATAPGFLPADHAGPTGWGRLVVGSAPRYADVDIVLRRGGAKVTGTVLDETGGVVPGALVRGKDFTRYGNGWTAVARCDDEGRFELWVPRGGNAIEAVAEGYATSVTAANAPEDGLEVRLMPEVTISGRVVDAAGAPVADARVRPGPVRNNAAEDFMSTRTDVDGRFELRRLTPGRYQPTAESPHGFSRASEAVTLAFGEPEPTLTLVMEPAATVHVTIDASPALGSCDGAWVDAMTEKRHDATPVSDGRATFYGIPRGSLALVSECRGLRVQQVLEVGEVDELEVVLSIEPLATVRGQVRVAEDGLGSHMAITIIPEGAVLDGPMLPKGYVLTRTDASGRFVAAMTEPGRFQVFGGTVSANELRLTEFEVVAGQDRDLGELVLPPLGRIEGRVLDPDGRGLGGLGVRVVKRSSLGAHTRADGSFEMAQLEVGEYVLHISQGALKLADDVTVVVRANETARVVLPGPHMNAALRGIVVDGDGEPVADAKVTVFARTPDPSSDELLRRVARVNADGEGHFSQDRLRPGEYDVKVSALVGGEEGAGCKGEARATAVADHTGDVVVTCR